MTNLAILLALAGGADADGLTLVRSALLREPEQKELRDDQVARRLAALGAPAAPALFALVEGSALELLLGDDEAPTLLLCPPEHLAEVALAALAALPSEQVLAALRQELAARPTVETRVTALRVLATQPGTSALGLTFEVLRAAGVELASPSVRVHARRALVAALHSDARAFAALAAQLATAEVPLLRLVAEALAATETEDGVRALEDLLGRDEELDAMVIASLAQAGLERPWRVGGEAAAALERLLASKSAARRAAAAEALGRLARVDSVPPLVARLDDPAPEVVTAALHALQSCAHASGPRERAEFRAWLAREQTWWQSEGQARVTALRSAEASALTEPLRGLLGHALARTETADALLERLDELDASGLVLACSTLARLGTREAVPDLVPLLDSEDEAVRTAAWSALRTLAGIELPAERSLWDEYVSGD